MNEPEEPFVCSDCGATVSEADRVCPRCGEVLEWGADPGAPGEGATSASLEPDVSPMGLGDIFDRTFRLFGKTFTRSIVIVLILFVPVSLILIEGSREFYGTIGTISQEQGGATSPAPEEIGRMLMSLGLFFVAILMAFIANLAGELAVTDMVRGEFVGSSVSWKAALTGAFSRRLVRAFGVVIAQVAIVCGVGFFAAIGVALAGEGAPIIALSLLAAIGCIVFLIIRWSLAFTILACEDRGVGKAFSRSWTLVAGRWWRTLGILMLLGIVVNFAIALVSTPLSLIAFWDFYKEYFRALGTAGAGQPDPAVMGKAMGSMGPGIGLSLSLNMMLVTLSKPVYTTVMYFDLRARNRVVGGDSPDGR